MSEHYTDEDVTRVAGILWDDDPTSFARIDGRWPATSAELRKEAKAVLDAVAPAIAARALLNAARDIDLDLGPGFDMSHDAAATRAAEAWLVARSADEIEGR